MSITDQPLSLCQATEMCRRLIAAGILASLTWWSLPVGPVLPMPFHTGRMARHSVGVGPDHSCCPGVHLRLVVPVPAQSQPAGMPCGDEHPCCARQRSGNPSFLPAANKIPKRDPEGSAETLSGQDRGARQGSDAQILSKVSFPSYSARSTVLRI